MINKPWKRFALIAFSCALVALTVFYHFHRIQDNSGPNSLDVRLLDLIDLGHPEVRIAISNPTKTTILYEVLSDPEQSPLRHGMLEPHDADIISVPTNSASHLAYYFAIPQPFSITTLWRGPSHSYAFEKTAKVIVLHLSEADAVRIATNTLFKLGWEITSYKIKTKEYESDWTVFFDKIGPKTFGDDCWVEVDKKTAVPTFVPHH